MIVDHSLAKLFHGFASTLLGRDLAEFNFLQAAYRRVHHEVAIVRVQVTHAGLFTGRSARVAIAAIRVAVLRHVHVAVHILVGVLATGHDVGPPANTTTNQMCALMIICWFLITYPPCVSSKVVNRRNCRRVRAGPSAAPEKRGGLPLPI